MSHTVLVRLGAPTESRPLDRCALKERHRC